MRYFITCLLLLFLLTGCGANDDAICIPADEFTNNYTGVKAYFSKDAPEFKITLDGKDFDGSNDKDGQLIKWKNTGIITNGSQLTVKITGKWTPWLGQNGTSSVSTKDICDICPGNCEIICEGSSTLQGAPCWLENGYGAYLLFNPPGAPDPNSSLEGLKGDKFKTLHLGFKKTPSQQNFTYGSSQGEESNFLQSVAGSTIYVKIVDTFYQDNAGGYTLQFLTGVEVTKITIVSDAYDQVRSLITRSPKSKDSDKPTEVQMQFRNLTQNVSFQALVRVIIAFSITYFGFTYLLGLSQRSISEIIIKLFKISLLVQLISPDSWNFYYSHFFALFVDGLDTILKMLLQAALLDIPEGKNALSFIDDLVFGELLTATTFTKVAGLLGSLPTGILWCATLLISLWVYIGGAAYIIMLTLVGWLSISLMLLIFPIMLAFILLELKFKDMMSNWIKFMLAQCLQIIISMAALALFTSLIMDNVHRILGVKICWNLWASIDLCYIPYICDNLHWKLYTWTFDQYLPTQLGLFRFSRGYYAFTDGMATRSLPIGCERSKKCTSDVACRHEDFPYLDWGLDAERPCPTDLAPPSMLPLDPQAADAYAIQGLLDGKFLEWAGPDLLSLLFLSVIFYYVKNSLVSIGAMLGGISPHTSTTLGGVVESMWKDAKSLIESTGITKPLEKFRKWREGVNAKARGTPENIQRRLGPLRFLTVPLINGGPFVTGTSSKEGSLSDKLEYKKHAVGSAIESITEPFSGTKFLAKHLATKRWTSEGSGHNRSVAESFKQAYKSDLETLHDGILGVKRPGPIEQPKVARRTANIGNIFHDVPLEPPISGEGNRDAPEAPPNNENEEGNNS